MIFLCGYKSCGKTTLAKAYSERNHVPYFDTDEQLLLSWQKHASLAENAALTSVADLHRHLGEGRFRQLEHKVLMDVLLGCKPFDPAIVALGGGAVMHLDSVKQMKERGKLVYLQTKSDTLLTRALKYNRWPSFVPEQDEQALLDHFKSRNGIYEQVADTVIDTEVLQLECQLEALNVIVRQGLGDYGE